MKSIEILNPSPSLKLTKEQAEKLGIDITQDIIHAEIETRGPWQIVTSFKALCISNTYEKSFVSYNLAKTEIHGFRKLSNPRQSGYELEGYVSINGKKYTAFTSSVLIEVDGKLINVATINARKNPMP